MKDNQRLKEIKLALYLNHMDYTKDRFEYAKMLKILSCVIKVLGAAGEPILIDIVKRSINGGIMGATNKEIYATLNHYFKSMKSARALHISQATYNKKYYVYRNSITDEYLESLEPVFKEKNYRIVIDVLISFIDKLFYPPGDKTDEIENNERTLELDFMLIYNSLSDIFGSNGATQAFVKNLCDAFYINYSSIHYLETNMHYITMSYPYSKYNSVFLTRELFTLFSKRGLKKGNIATKVLGKSGRYAYEKSNLYKVAGLSEREMYLYSSTISWDPIDKNQLILFFNTIRTFYEYMSVLV